MSNEHEAPILLGRDTAEPLILPRKLLRQACVDADISEQTATRILAGLPGRGGTRDRLVAALSRLGAPAGAVPPAPAKVMTMKHDPADDDTATPTD